MGTLDRVSRDEKEANPSGDELAREFSGDRSHFDFWQAGIRRCLSGPSRDRGELIQSLLIELASEFGARWAALLELKEAWNPVAEWGRRPVLSTLEEFLSQVWSRQTSSRCSLRSGVGEQTVWAASLESSPECRSPFLLVLLVPGTIDSLSEHGLALRFRMLLTVLDLFDDQLAHQVKEDRWREILAVSTQLAGLPDVSTVLRSLVESAARMLHCERASLFLWDREHHELIACPALGLEGESLRISDDQGIAGECVRTGQVIQSENVHADTRFDSGIDQQTGFRTRNLLCVPVMDARGECLGAIEVLNRKEGIFGPLDVETLQALGRHALVTLQNVRERERLLRRQRLGGEDGGGIPLIGQSPAIAALRETIERLAQTDLPVLVLGESGTGKEVVAQSLHLRGPRSEHPFIAVNCGALPENLLESELFGHEKGAFTDARETRLGKFELAEGGTLFLDELADLSLAGQAKLLRVLEQREITRVGGSRAIRVNVRIVAATNRQLQQAVRERRFRDDLYYRLAVVTVELPPLRDRLVDVVPLAEFFLDKFSRQAGRRGMRLSEAAQSRLQSHAWPGNVRELRNLMERVAFLAPAPEVSPEDLAFLVGPERDSSVDSTELGLSEATDQFQIGYIRRMIQRVQGNMTEAANRLGLHRSNLYRKMRGLGMEEHRAESRE